MLSQLEEEIKDIIIRAGVIEDAEKCAEIVSTWIHNTDWMPSLHTQSELTAMIKEAIPQREVWVLGRPIIGYLSFNVELSQVTGLYTKTHGKGFGKALVDKIKGRYQYINLWSHSENKNAHRFYLREGFTPINFKERGGDGIPETQFEWTGSDRM